MEVKRDDIIQLILQFCRESSFYDAVKSLQRESGVSLNQIDDLESFRAEIVNGKWDSVLLTVSNLKLRNETLLLLYELVICELLEVNETQVANRLLTSLMVPILGDFKEALLRLDYLIRKPTKLNISEIYTDDLSKTERRSKIANDIISQCLQLPPSRLEQLLGEALRFRVQNKLLDPTSKPDLLRDKILDNSINCCVRVDKIIKYSEEMRVNSAVSYDGNLITGSVDGIIEVWDQNKQVIRLDLEYQKNENFMAHNHSIIALAMNSNSLLVSLDSQGVIKIWKPSTGVCLKKIQSTHSKPITTITLTNDVLLVASTEILMHGLKNGSVLRSYREHQSGIQSVVATGSRIYSGSSDGMLKIWDLNSNEQLFQLQYDSSIVKIISHQEQVLITTAKKAILLSQTLTTIKEFNINEAIINSHLLGQYFYLLSNVTNQLYVFNFPSGTPHKVLKLNTSQALDITGTNSLFLFSQLGELTFIKP